MNDLTTHLGRYDATAWRRTLDTLEPQIHLVDRAAVRIWFAFFPLGLFLALEAAELAGEDPAAVIHRFGLMGQWRLRDQIDTSHRFLYAHRYWPQVKSAVLSVRARPDTLAELVTAVADAAARTARVDREMLLAMSFVGLMTFRQAGAAAFSAAPGKVHLTPEARRMTPHQVIGRRAQDDWQGVFGFLRGLKKRWTVTFDENEPGASFTIINGQEVASAPRDDKRDYRSRDPRCTPGEGPIPVECRAASCGTCWVGVIGGAEKLSPVVANDEGRRMKVFGYIDTNEPLPLIRLACQARASGAVSVVIPPWNGMFGKISETK